MKANILFVGLAYAALGGAANAQHAGHTMTTPADLTWTKIGGVQITIIEGSIAEAVPFTIRLKFPARWKIAPHWHPNIEHVTIISGELNLGVGDTFDQTKTKPLPTGSIAIIQPETNHYGWIENETIVQLHGVGPWTTNYVTEADLHKK